MVRVKYPFIVRYRYHDGDRFAREPDKNKAEIFKQVYDQLDATVYRNLKQFKEGFRMSPTEWLREADDPVDLIYVG